MTGVAMRLIRALGGYELEIANGELARSDEATRHCPGHRYRTRGPTAEAKEARHEHAATKHAGVKQKRPAAFSRPQ